ncbi:MAG: metallophosphoesterase [Clostridia bacterium]|nr:metallophosphoesterase [Clostridia bacterium]
MNDFELPAIFASYPAVYAVRDRYVITVPVSAESVMRVDVGAKSYYDDSNGILRSSSRTHIIELPASELDREGKYTVVWRKVNERKPYFSDLGEEESVSFDFRPIPPDKETVNLFNLADAHNRVSGPVAAGGWFGDDLDLLVLNGDIPNHSGDVANFASIHRIAGGITHGALPVVFSRGNHDTRGIFAEKLAEHTPTDCGRSYYTVRVGPVWAAVLDCAEDKPDGNAEYGHTVCCHDFRLRETEFLRRVADSPDTEYAAPGVRFRLVIVHNPFNETLNPPFDIEQELYAEWCATLREKVKPDLMLCGHIHKCYVTYPGTGRDAKGAPCPVVVSSRISKEDKEFFEGGAVSLSDGEAVVRFVDNRRNVSGEERILLAKRGK